MGKTGLTGKITFTTSTWTAKILSIALGAVTRADIDCTHLESVTNMESAPAPLTAHAPETITYLYEQNNLPPFEDAVESVKIEFPLVAGDSVAAKKEGTAYINSFTPPTLTADGRMEGTFQLQWDGVTGPLFTDGTV